MLVVPIKSALQFDLAHQKGDAIEFRLDLFSDSELIQIPQLKKRTTKPVIFTFKSLENKYLDLLSVKPDYIDLPYEIPFTWPSSKRIASYHNFERTPENLEEILLQMGVADYYKVVTYANSSLDAMRMLRFLQKQKEPLIAFCMGERGRFSRLLAPIYGSWTFAALSEAERTAAGQLVLEKSAEITRFREVDNNTKVYALLGESLEKSPSHIAHNDYFSNEGINAFYTKIPLHAIELKEFFALAKELGFGGFSVTMPLKVSVAEYLHNGIEVCNTIVRKKEGFFGYNTDGAGALNAIEKKGHVRDKKMVILGAGSSAYAIGKEALRRGAIVTFVNRTFERAKSVAKKLGARVAREVEEYDILVNATSCESIEAPFTPDAIVLDIMHGTTPFTQRARASGCKTITGYEMFLEQGRLQYDYFFNG